MKEAGKSSEGDAPDLGALADWAPELARTFVSLASDIALVIDEAGVIRNVEQPNGDPIGPGAQQWVGRAWIDTVSGETRTKIRNLLKEVAATGIARRREVNHPIQAGVSIPVAYTAIRLGEGGPVLAVGRDLRAIAAIQQRFIDSQLDMERGYWQARQAESRYRLLFQVATDAIMVVDAESLQIIEANHASGHLFDIPVEQLTGRHVAFGFELHARSAVTELMNSARSSGKSSEIRARLSGAIKTTSVAATSFRADDTMRLLVRVREIDTAASDSTLNTTLARLVDGTRDGVVVTDSSGRILVANPAFVGLLKLNGEIDVNGHPLMDWLGLPDRPLSSLLTQVRRNGIARNVESRLKSTGMPALNVEVSAALLTEGDQECVGFTIHPLPHGQPASAYNLLVGALESHIRMLGDQLGTVQLDELLRRAASMAESHLIDVALLRASGDTRVAAGMVGLSATEFERRRSVPGADSSTDRDRGADGS